MHLFLPMITLHVMMCFSSFFIRFVLLRVCGHNDFITIEAETSDELMRTQGEIEG